MVKMRIALILACMHFIQTAAIEEKKLVIVITSYNNADWYDKNVGMMFCQKHFDGTPYENYRIIYVDDCSLDATSEFVECFIHNNNQSHRCILIKNKTRKRALANLYCAIQQCEPDEIVFNMDGDDWLADEFVFAKINEIYQNPNINDAPSLVAADIGIGMGGIGTEVAKEASDIILLDDSVVNIIHAIEEGRHTIYTLQRVISYFFSTNLAEILIILFAFIIALLYPGLHLAFPLTAAQILWLNLITDGFLDSALALEKKEKGLLFEQKWLKSDHVRLIDFTMLRRILFAAIPMALGSLFIFILYSQYDLLLARTMTLVTLGMFQWFNAWNCRSDTKSIFQIGLLSNRWLLLALAVVFILQLSLLHVPFLQKIFATEPLNIYQWLFIAVVSSSIIWLEEARKWFARRREA